MEMQIKFDPTSHAEIGRCLDVLHVLNQHGPGPSLTRATPAPVRGEDRDAWVIEFLEKNGPSRHRVLGVEGKRHGVKVWTGAKYRLMDAGKIVKRGLGLYALPDQDISNQEDE